MSHDPAEEDLYWTGYSSWALWPGVAAYGLGVFLLLSFARTIFNQLDIEHQWGSLLVVPLSIALALAITCFGLYRGSSYVYRLTPRHLYCDFGFFFRPTDPIPLSEILQVKSWRPLWLSPLDIGHVYVTMRNRPVLRLPGVRHPDRFVQLIQQTRAKAGSS